MGSRIDVDTEKIAEFCRRWNVTELALFGSVLREDFGPESDVDVLVTFALDARVGLIMLGKMEIELAALLGRKVGLVTKGGLKSLIRDHILATSEVLYAA
jgi:hypothetical protein